MKKQPLAKTIVNPHTRQPLIPVAPGTSGLNSQRQPVAIVPAVRNPFARQK